MSCLMKLESKIVNFKIENLIEMQEINTFYFIIFYNVLK